MERVQITGGGNGIYTDTKGRRLYTMGDYSPAVGEWVWTNGTTIYGHQSAGNAPCCNINDACLPYTCSGEMRGVNGCYADQLADLSFNRGKIDTIIPARIAAYAGDKNHAYVGLLGDYKGMKWFNVLTGEYLGNFTPDDACIDKKGNLVTIEHQNGVVTYRDQIVENDIDLSYAGPDIHIPIEKASFDAELEDEITIYGLFHRPLREIYKIVRRDNVEEIDPFVLIRVNGKVVKRIDKRSGFIGEGLLEAEKSTIAIINDVDASGDATGSERSNVPYSAKPPSGINCIYLYMNNIKVYPDLNCSMNISFSVSANAYPFISTDSIDSSGNGEYGEYSVTYEYSDDAPQSPEAKKYFDFLKNYWKENPQCYTHKVKIKLNGLRMGRYKDWITVKINKSIQISVECGGIVKKNYTYVSVFRRNSYSLKGAAISGGDSRPSDKNGSLLGKYNFNYTESWTKGFLYERTYSHQGFKNFPMVLTTILGVFMFPHPEIIDKSAWEGEISIFGGTPFSEEKKVIPVQTNYNIGNGFSIVLELMDKYRNGTVQSFKLYYHGKFVINSLGTQLQYLASSWINIRATALSNGRFLISCTNLSMPPLIVEHGEAKVMSNIAYSYINYTLANFKNKKRLKSSLKNLLKTL